MTNRDRRANEIAIQVQARFDTAMQETHRYMTESRNRIEVAATSGSKKKTATSSK